jgi:hypothetical protein
LLARPIKLRQVGSPSCQGASTGARFVILYREPPISIADFALPERRLAVLSNINLGVSNVLEYPKSLF